ncbi:CHAT domain-containing protein [Mycena pura]|uniref:CHAT domain-containing protein n=1 Tax=Mycena pura TaxID=153505 RepID=A0AAD6VDU5_9AGAR|nr:CHAT domain-containing protein [Mycena pura]
MHEKILFLPVSDLNRGRLLNLLGDMCLKQWETSQVMDDLNQAVYAYEDALRDDPTNVTYLGDLGSSLRLRFLQLGEVNDIDKAVLLQKEMVHLTMDGDPNKARMLTDLGTCLQIRFEQLGDSNDINTAVSQHQDALHLSPDGHPVKRIILGNLGNSLLARFEKLGDLADLGESVSKQEEVVCMTSHGHPDRPRALSQLGNSLGTRFEYLDDVRDLNECISYQQEAVHLTPDHHPEKPDYLSNLGTFLGSRFDRLGDIGDLNESISTLQKAVYLTADGHPHKPPMLNNLGNSFQRRFQRFGDLHDLNESILKLGEVVRLTPDGHPDKHRSLNNLGIALRNRFERLGDLDDLHESVLKHEDTVRLIPDGHPNKADMLTNLGISLNSRFEQLGSLEDLNRCISKQEEAVQITPGNHSKKLNMLNNLGNSLQSRFKRLGDHCDLDDSILRQRDAMNLTPEGHADKAGRQEGLGNALLHRFAQFRDPHDLEETIHQYTSAAHSTTSPAHKRFHAAWIWALSAHITQHPSLLQAYHVALDLLPEVAWLGLSINDRHHQIIEAGGVVRAAAATAITFGQLEKAVEWLEQGRSIIWGQLVNLRTPVDDLKQKHPELAEEFVLISAHLESTTNRGSDLQPTDPGTQKSLQSIAQQAHENAQKRVVLLNKIRELEGFQHFLLPKTMSELSPAAQKGPVIFLNVGKTSCDALLLLPGLNVLHEPLPEFTPMHVETLTKSFNRLVPYMGRGDIERLHGQREGGSQGLEDDFAHILSELWLRLVKPILDGLAITTPQNDNLPRIWWCPTGPLTSLPIHAAGLYGNADTFGSKLSDFAISSYTPSLAALIQGFRPMASSLSPHDHQLLAVAQPFAIGQNRLPGTLEEINRIQQCAKDKLPVLPLIGDEATIARVEEGMKKSTWVHFACHGVQNVHTPTESALLLAGSSQLTLSRIIQLNLPHANFAFLSACQSATGDRKLQEESVHLAAGMLLAGYRGVIATMWSIMDNDAPQVASDVYEHLFRTSPPDSTRAAEALHFATRNYREGPGGNKSFFHWVPFIHVGV